MRLSVPADVSLVCGESFAFSPPLLTFCGAAETPLVLWEHSGGMDKAAGLPCWAQEEADSLDVTEWVFVAEGGELTAVDAVR